MKYYLSKNYKRYGTGGPGVTDAMGTQGIAAVGSLASGIIDSFDQPDVYGRRSLLGSSTSAGIQGGLAAAIPTLINQSKINKQANQLEITDAMARDRNQRRFSGAVFANNPSLVYGNQGAGYYAMGGSLSKNYLSSQPTVGGSLKPLSSESVEVEGPSHENGGVQLPDSRAEVEGKETMHNDFVFSDRLGFADEHRKIAKAIGKIESKGVMSRDRTNALDRLNERQENLKLSQEYFKQMLMAP